MGAGIAARRTGLQSIEEHEEHEEHGGVRRRRLCPSIIARRRSAVALAGYRAAAPDPASATWQPSRQFEVHELLKRGGGRARGLTSFTDAAASVVVGPLLHTHRVPHRGTAATAPCPARPPEAAQEQLPPAAAAPHRGRGDSRGPAHAPGAGGGRHHALGTTGAQQLLHHGRQPVRQRSAAWEARALCCRCAFVSRARTRLAKRLGAPPWGQAGVPC